MQGIASLSQNADTSQQTGWNVLGKGIFVLFGNDIVILFYLCQIHSLWSMVGNVFCGRNLVPQDVSWVPNGEKLVLWHKTENVTLFKRFNITCVHIWYTWMSDMPPLARSLYQQHNVLPTASWALCRLMSRFIFTMTLQEFNPHPRFSCSSSFLQLYGTVKISALRPALGRHQNAVMNLPLLPSNTKWNVRGCCWFFKQVWGCAWRRVNLSAAN